MTFVPFAPVDPPVPQAERYRLLTVANGPIETVEGPDGERVPVRVYGGVTYEPLFCGDTHDYAVVCGPDESPGELPGGTKDFDFQGPAIEGEPFVIYSSLQCGSGGHEDMRGWMRNRVLTRFATGEATGVERNVARLMAATPGVPLLSPADPTDIVSVLATLEQWLYGVQDVMSSIGPVEGIAYNYRGYIHATPRVAAYAADAHLIDDRGAFKLTPLGSVWVFGGGYNGAAPGDLDPVDGVDTIYATGQVTLWRDPEIQLPPLRQTFDRATNQWYALAERGYAVAFDCGVAAAPFEYGAVSP